MSPLTGLVIIGIIIILILLSRKTRERVVEVCVDQIIRKNANKEKILNLLKERRELTNEEIRDTLGVSPRSVVRYMDQLERSGQVEQVGDTGRGVSYRLK